MVLQLPMKSKTRKEHSSTINDNASGFTEEDNATEGEGSTSDVERDGPSCAYRPNSDIDREGTIYTKARDPPGQKCIYILPGNNEKETYRLSTFLKFPEDVEVDICALAAHGFYYIGYKDRTKCFSCGSVVYDWRVFDRPNDAKWHLLNCLLVLGKETRNEPILKKKLNFVGKFETSIITLDSGSPGPVVTTNGDASAKQVAKTASDRINENRLASSSSQSDILSRDLSGMKIDSPGATKNDATTLPVRQSARFVNSAPKTPPPVIGLVLASIVSSFHLEQLSKKLDLHKEEDRKKSFVGWSYNFNYVTPGSLAKDGFFYLGNSDRVQCFSCTGVLRNWSMHDTVEDQHKSHFPQCRMVLKTESRNIPLPESKRNLPLPNLDPIPEPPDPTPEELSRLREQFPCLEPVNAHMREYQLRVQTFDHRWPKNKTRATVHIIAKAGFYFLGERDRAKCWYCNGGLQNWEVNDEPFTEHAKFYPGCEYLLQCKGVDFVKEVVRKFPNVRRPTLRNSRFDHINMEVLPAAPNAEQQPPPLIDPQANGSAGDVLQSFSPRKPQLQNGVVTNGVGSSSSSEMEEQAIGMGFTKTLIKQVVERQVRENGRNFENAQELISALLDQPAENNVVSVNQFREDVAPALGASSSLKRNNDVTPQKNAEVNSSSGEGETPFKKIKKGGKWTNELADLENERLCKSCFENVADVVVMNCGHLSLCNNCSTTVKFCPVCKNRIQSTIRAYLV